MIFLKPVPSYSYAFSASNIKRHFFFIKSGLIYKLIKPYL